MASSGASPTDTDTDTKINPNEVELVEDAFSTPAKPNGAPAYVRNLAPEDRKRIETSLRRKVDTRLLPMIVLIYIMNYLDRNNIAAAKLAGLETDLNLTGDQFQTSVSILFVGYLLMQVPSNLLLNKLGKPSLYLPGCMVVWGLSRRPQLRAKLMVVYSLVDSFLVLLRQLTFPVACIIFQLGSLLSGAFSGLITAGITHGLDGAKGLRAWRWLFIVEGSITIFIALFAFFILPDLPRTTSWLSEDEKELAAWRLEEDIGQDDWVDSKQQTFLHGAKLAAKDPKAWLLLATIYGFTSAGTVTTLFPSVVKGLGRGNIESLLLTTPPYLIAVIAILCNAWHADASGERYLHIAGPPVLAFISFAIAAGTTKFAPRYLAMCLMVGANYSGYVVALSWISNVLPRPPSKRAAALAGINALSNVAQIYSPYLYPSSDAPRYAKAMYVNLSMSVVSIIFATILRFHLVRLNKKLDRGEIVEGVNSRAAPGRSVEEGEGEEVAVDRGFRFLY
ncbi:pantothenate transporter liz1 [Botrytis cinerea]